MRIPVLLPVALLAALACADVDSVDTDASVRIIHASPTAPILDAVLDFDVIANGLQYAETSGYIAVEANTHTFQFRSSNADIIIDRTPLVSTRLALATDGRYTVLAVSALDDLINRDENRDRGRSHGRRRESVAPFVLLDDATAPGPDSVRLRIVQAAPASGRVDVYLTAPSTDLDSTGPTLSGLFFRSAADYLTFVEGEYRIRVTIAGTRTVILDSGNLEFLAGQVLTAVLLEAPAGGALSALAFFPDAR